MENNTFEQELKEKFISGASPDGEPLKKQNPKNPMAASWEKDMDDNTYRQEMIRALHALNYQIYQVASQLNNINNVVNRMANEASNQNPLV